MPGGQSVGMPEKKASKAASPPAEAPMPTIGKSVRGSACSCTSFFFPASFRGLAFSAAGMVFAADSGIFLRAVMMVSIAEHRPRYIFDAGNVAALFSAVPAGMVQIA